MKMKERFKNWRDDNKLYNSERSVESLIKKRDSYKSQRFIFMVIDIFLFVVILISIMRFIETSILFISLYDKLEYDYVPILFVFAFGLLFLIFISIRLFLYILFATNEENFIDLMIMIKKNKNGDIENGEKIICRDNKN